MQKYFQPFKNEKTGLKEILVPATVLSVNNNTLTTSSNKPYRICRTKVQYINGEKQVFRSNISEDILLWFNIQTGDEITLRFQLEGQFANYWWVEIPYENFENISPLKFNSILWVDDIYRISDLSLDEGGSDVIIEYNDGRILGYNKIKHLAPYLKEVLKAEIKDFESMDLFDQLKMVRIYVSDIYIYNDNWREINKFYKKVWNNKDNINSPWDLLNYLD